MNNRRDQQFGRQSAPTQNEPYDDRVDMRGGRGADDWRSDSARSGWGPAGGGSRFGGARGREGYGGDWRTEGLGGGDWTRQQYGYGEASRGGYSYANENLANDFSLEGTQRFEQQAPQISHRGKGPKGFKRTDERVKELVSEALADHHFLDASEIEVDVKESEVTLTGTVTDRGLKRLAEDIVEAVPGVLDVHNQLRIAKGVQQGTDLGLGREARQNMTAPRSQH